MTKTKTIQHTDGTVVSGASYAYKSQDSAAQAQRRATGNTRTVEIVDGDTSYYPGAGQLWLVDGKQVPLAVGRRGELVRLVNLRGLV